MNLSKFALILILIIFLSNSAFSQDDELDSFSFEEQELQEESIPYFAIGGGFNLTFVQLNLDDLNSHISEVGFDLDDLNATLISYGGEIFIGVVFVPNLRTGFYWTNGSSSSSKTLTTNLEGNNLEVERTMDLNLTQSGISFEYALRPFRGVSFAILPGVSLGWGLMTIDSYQSTDNISWEDIDANANATNYFDRVESSFYFSKFNLQLEYAFTTFFQLRAGAAYNLSFNYDWQYNNTISIDNVPDGINANGLQFQVGLHVGLFNY